MFQTVTGVILCICFSPIHFHLEPWWSCSQWSSKTCADPAVDTTSFRYLKNKNNTPTLAETHLNGHTAKEMYIYSCLQVMVLDTPTTSSSAWNKQLNT